MTRARMPRPHEVAAARRDPRLLRAVSERSLDSTWRTRGVCQSVDPEIFFPAPSEPADAAVALCRTCDVQGPCLAWALDVGDCHGVWGATTPRERRAMLVAWRGQVSRISQVNATTSGCDGAETDLAAVEAAVEAGFVTVEAAVELTPADRLPVERDLAADLAEVVAAAVGGSRSASDEMNDAIRERLMSLLPAGTT